jgi:hypothetical protein
LELEGNGNFNGGFVKRAHRHEIRATALGSAGVSTSTSTSTGLPGGAAASSSSSSSGFGSGLGSSGARSTAGGNPPGGGGGGDDDSDDSGDASDVVGSVVDSSAVGAAASKLPKVSNMMPPLGLWLDSIRLGAFVVQLRSLPGGGVATLSQLLAMSPHEVGWEGEARADDETAVEGEGRGGVGARSVFFLN